MKSKTIVSLSGGIDSTTVLAEVMANQNEQVLAAISFRYGSKHNRFEIKAAELIAKHYQIPHQVIDLQSAMKNFKSNLLLGYGEIPNGHYADENMKLTVVPGRNLIFVSILIGLAQSMNAQKVYVGIHQGDHAIYPDCRPEFYYSIKTIAEIITEGKVTVEAPFLNTSKTGIVERGLALAAPYHLTRTCYKYQAHACGECGSCVERLEAFANNQATDPITYTSS